MGGKDGSSSPTRSVAVALCQLQVALNAADRQEAINLDFDAEDLTVLRSLKVIDKQRVGALGTEHGATRAAMSARLDRLERKGYLRRHRVPGDRRAVVASLTTKGHRIAERSLSRLDDTARTARIVELSPLSQLREALRAREGT